MSENEKKLQKMTKKLGKLKVEYNELIENAPDAMFELNLSGKFTAFNKRAQKQTGYSKRDVIGKAFSTILPPDKILECSEMIKKVLSDKPVRGFETQIVNKNGERIWVELNARPIKENGNIIGIQGIARDYTERKRKQKLIEQKIEELKKARQTTYDFIKIISHELKTPMTPIKGYLELLLEEKFGSLTKKQREILKIILRSIDQSQHFIDDLSNLSMLESGQMRFKMRNIQLLDVITDVKKEMGSFAIEKNIKIKIDFPKNFPTVWADYDAITEVMTNLLHNAIKFTRKGGSILIKAMLKPNEAVVMVKDSGIGIPKKDLKKIFSKFYKKIPSAVNEEGSESIGTGLGLSICKTIVEKHHGKIWVESEFGKGSTFYFSLPLKKPPNESEK